MNVTEADLKTQLAHAKTNGLYQVLATAAQNYGLPLAYVLAIGSRETNLQNIIGDEGYGIGVMQVDTQHDIARQARFDGSWKTHPEKLVAFACDMLAYNVVWARSHYPKFGGTNGRGWFKIAASAYNAGTGGAADGITKNGDSDEMTTGGDYGRDVLERMDVLARLVASGG